VDEAGHLSTGKELRYFCFKRPDPHHCLEKRQLFLCWQCGGWGIGTLRHVASVSVQLVMKA
jgi:hypothetical protein